MRGVAMLTEGGMIDNCYVLEETTANQSIPALHENEINVRAAALLRDNQQNRYSDSSAKARASRTKTSLFFRKKKHSERLVV